jgi:hypothetical protein
MHAASDGSFGRSAAGSTARGVVLLVIALGLGILLLQSTDRSPTLTTTQSAAPTTVTPTTAPAPAVTTSTLPPARDPKTVKVLAANGSVVNGLALKTKEKLQAAGYDALSPVTANLKVTATQIYYAPGYQSEGLAVAAVLGVPATVVQPVPAKVPVANPVGANVLVLAGPDLAQSLGSTTTTTIHKTTATTAKAAAATTTTTAHAASSTTTAAPSSTTSTTKKP